MVVYPEPPRGKAVSLGRAEPFKEEKSTCGISPLCLPFLWLRFSTGKRWMGTTHLPNFSSTVDTWGHILLPIYPLQVVRSVGELMERLQA